MARKRNDRDQMLDRAEAIVRDHGAAALTIDALAKAMGITKGGVQYCFPSKAALIAALAEKWQIEYDDRFQSFAGGDPSPDQAVRAHVAATHGAEGMPAKAAGLMAQLFQQPDQLASIQRWYRSSMTSISGDDGAASLRRVAYLASEGAFFLRFFGLLDMTHEESLEILRTSNPS